MHFVHVCMCMCAHVLNFRCRKTFNSPLFTNTRKIFKVQACEIIKKPQVLFLAMKQNYVTEHYWHIHQFDLFSKTLYSSRKASISFAYLVLQLLLVRRTQHRGLSKMTNQKSSNVSKVSSRESAGKLLLSFCLPLSLLGSSACHHLQLYLAFQVY